jgi:hypothetical protein
MRRPFFVVVLATLLLLPAAARATTWDQWHAEHPIKLRRPTVGENLRPADVQAIAEWLRRVQRRTNASYHRWEALRAQENLDVAPQVQGNAPISYTGDHLSLWLCIHAQEGSWLDPDPPYFGGLQMGYGFMEAYGGSLYAEKGTADHWTPDEQIGVAEAAWDANGYGLGWLFSQWPATAPPCV